CPTACHRGRSGWLSLPAPSPTWPGRGCTTGSRAWTPARPCSASGSCASCTTERPTRWCQRPTWERCTWQAGAEPHSARRPGRRVGGMPRVVFMCGPAGSGKSTVARELEAGGLVRLSFDDAAWARGLRTMPLSKQAYAEIEQDLQRRLVGLVRDGHDVVLDLS